MRLRRSDARLTVTCIHNKVSLMCPKHLTYINLRYNNSIYIIVIGRDTEEKEED